jgi:dTDP-4-amino-4,6-dideoxygalactose transaminase
VAEFEQAFARIVGSAEAVVCANGTAALHLACLAIDLGPGDNAVVPSVTFLATANAVRMTGADVVFADVDPDTGLMTAETFSAALEKDMAPIKAVFPVHLNGQSCDMAGIKAIADKHGITTITDCCHALGGEYAGDGVPGDGKYEVMGCFSLHPVKAVAMGEGGVITTNDANLANKMRRLRSHDMVREAEYLSDADLSLDSNGQPNPWAYEMHDLGYNYRANDIQCALGLSQLGKLGKFANERREIAANYDRLLSGLNHIKPIDKNGFSISGWHLYAVLIEFDALSIARSELMDKLRVRNIGTQVHYIPVHQQPYYRNLYGVQDLPGVKGYYSRVLSLPIYPGLRFEQQEYVINSLVELLN